MSSEEPQLVNLTALGKTPATEISISDGHFREIELPNNAGRVDVRLPVGMYTVMFREGDASVEQVASLLPGSDTITVEQAEPAAFESAVPLDGTRTSHEWHQASASFLSASPPRVSDGSANSELLIFVRDLGEPILIELDETLRRREHLASDVEFRLDLETPVAYRFPTYTELDDLDPTEGLTVHRISGKPLTDVVPQDPTARVGGLLARLEPGTFRLRLNTGTDLVLEMPIACVDGRQTQLFLLCRDYGEHEQSRRADFDSASVSLGWTGENFDPGAQTRRLTEVALQALAARRPLHGADLTGILEEKFDDPMLGILGAHLLLLDENPDTALLSTIIGNTGAMLEAHPDVDALRLREALLKNALPDTVPRFAAPPMLAASWEAVVAATRMDADIVPAGSLSDLVSDRLTRRGPWLVWAGPPELDSISFSPETPSDPVDQVATALRDPMIHERVQGLPTLTPSERAVATSIEPAVDSFYRKLMSVGLVAEQRRNPTENDVSAALNLPVNSVRRLSGRLLEKLG